MVKLVIQPGISVLVKIESLLSVRYLLHSVIGKTYTGICPEYKYTLSTPVRLKYMGEGQQGW